MRIFFFLVLPFCLFAQTGGETAIRILQDNRDPRAAELVSYLRSERPRERELALLALANIQDTTAYESALSLINDDDPRVRAMAAFTIGMAGKPKSSGVLFRRLSVERDEKCIAALFNAIGLSGTTDDLKKMVNQTEDYPQEWAPYVAQSIYRFANRKIKDAAATKHAVALLDDRSAMINACYALMRINDTTILKNNSGRIRRLMNNASPLIRMWGSTMLGSLDDAASVSALMTAAAKDKDWRVRVNAVRALRTKRGAMTGLTTLISDPNEHTALAAVGSVSALIASDTIFSDSAVYLKLLHSPGVLPAVKDELRLLLAKKMGERAIKFIGEWRSNSPHSSSQRIRAYGETGSERALPVIKDALKTTASSTILIAGLEAYQAIARRAGAAIQKDFLKTAALMVANNDAGVSFTAAVAFQDTNFSSDIRSIFLSALNSAFIGMQSPKDLEPMVELLNVFTAIGDSTVLKAVNKGLSGTDNVIRSAANKAFIAITGNAPPNTFVPSSAVSPPFYTPADLVLLERYTGAEIVTSKGKITVQFEKKAAPFTVLNFILLAKKKFYDGLSFHRVVSNFVIQGGDPLGNGSGGPEYSIRTEVHPEALYKTGAVGIPSDSKLRDRRMVGMASSGKDTEGSQFFIIHSSQPHLDYRYTIFASTLDAAVVDQIQVGDWILSCTLVKR
jgi:peptidylprolyl isomerase